MARMIGRSSDRPTVYGIGTGRMKKCHGCWDGCGYCAPDNATQRRREDRGWRRNWIDEYEEDPRIVARSCPKGGPGCGCNE